MSLIVSAPCSTRSSPGSPPPTSPSPLVSALVDGALRPDVSRAAAADRRLRRRASSCAAFSPGRSRPRSCRRRSWSICFGGVTGSGSAFIVAFFLKTGQQLMNAALLVRTDRRSDRQDPPGPDRRPALSRDAGRLHRSAAARTKRSRRRNDAERSRPLHARADRFWSIAAPRTAASRSSTCSPSPSPSSNSAVR